MLRDILRGEDAQIAAIVAVIDHTLPDILLLTDFDFDAGGAAMTAFNEGLSRPYEYRFSRRPNAGVQTGLDVDGDGFAGDARDAMGYGRFLGDGGMVLLSRYPILTAEVEDLTGVLWKDIPDAQMPVVDGAAFPSPQVHEVLPASSSGHWIVPIDVDGVRVTVLAYAATAPVFDGPEDFNGLRNRAELQMFEDVLDRPQPPARPILIGNVNADPSDGQGVRSGIEGVLARADLRDPLPKSQGARLAADGAHLGDPAVDTADWSDDGPGNLRVSYVLPSLELGVRGAGVFWPAPDDPLARLLGEDGFAAGPHRLVWVDIDF